MQSLLAESIADKAFVDSYWHKNAHGDLKRSSGTLKIALGVKLAITTQCWFLYLLFHSYMYIDKCACWELMFVCLSVRVWAKNNGKIRE